MLARSLVVLSAALLGTGVLVRPLTACANGRFPRAQRLVEDPRDPDHLVLAATYGLLTTSDRGQNWYHICEASFSRLEMYVGDPLFDFASDNTMLVDVQAGLNRSTNEGCAWETAIGQNGNEEVVDFTVSTTERGRILALKSSAEEGSIVVRLLESNDDGRTFHPTGSPLPIATAFTVEIAPSDPTRVYATGISRSNTGHLLLSKDRGHTWESKSIPATSFDAVPFVSAVHPRDADQIFVRIDGRFLSEVDGRYHANDAVLFTKDGGDTWSEIHRAEGKALGFALSRDGSELLLGYGSDGVFEVDEAALGIYASSTERFEFTRLQEGSVTCLAWTDNGIYVCTPQSKAGRELAFAPRAGLGSNGEGLQTLLRLPDVRGPLPCCVAKASVCRAAWPTACQLLQACADGSTMDTCGPDASDDRSADAAAKDVGASSDSGAVTVPAAACSCRLPSMQKTADEPLRWPACLSASALASLVRRRRGSRSMR